MEEVVGGNEFAEEWDKSLSEWNKNEERDLDNTVRDYGTKDNHELEEENRRIKM